MSSAPAEPGWPRRGRLCFSLARWLDPTGQREPPATAGGAALEMSFWLGWTKLVDIDLDERSVPCYRGGIRHRKNCEAADPKPVLQNIGIVTEHRDRVCDVRCRILRSRLLEAVRSLLQIGKAVADFESSRTMPRYSSTRSSRPTISAVVLTTASLTKASPKRSAPRSHRSSGPLDSP